MNKETLTSRARVMRAINHQPVDRVPIDLGVHYSTGISAFAYWNLRKYLGLDTGGIQVPDMTQFLARVDEDILRRFHCDCMLLAAPWLHTKRWNPRGKYKFTIPSTAPLEPFEGGWIMERGNARLRMPEGGFFFDGDGMSYEERDPESAFQAVTREAERIFKETDYATLLMGFGAYFSRDVNWLCDALLEPEKIQAGNAAACERNIEHAGRIIDHMGGYIQGICLNNDMGIQTGPMCSPAMIEQVSAPYIKRFCAFVHENSDLKVFLHSCGSVRALIPMFIDCGIDILNPVQISAANMDPAELVSEFGGKIVFWGGGCDTQNVLGVKTPAEVADHVRGLMSIWKQTNGFVFNQVHNVMGDVPPENVVAMLDTAYEESFR